MFTIAQSSKCDHNCLQNNHLKYSLKRRILYRKTRQQSSHLNWAAPNLQVKYHNVKKFAITIKNDKLTVANDSTDSMIKPAK